jgi:hypothetical protein
MVIYKALYMWLKCLFFSGILTGVQSYKTLRAKITPVQKFLGMFFVPIKPNSK